MRDSTYRAVLWEQAKGLLRGITVSYENEKENFEEFDKELEEFIKHVEDHAIGGFT